MKRVTFFLAIVISSVCFGQQERLGLKFTPADKLQAIPRASTPAYGAGLPASVDFSGTLPPAGNQGRQGSCVAWAVAYAYKSYQEKKEEKTNYYINGQLNLNAVFSPAFIYNQINNGRDGGSFFADALNVLSQQGAAKWADMPYNEFDYLTKPNATQLSKAKPYKIEFWRRVNAADINEAKAQLHAGFPVIIGAIVDREFVEGGRNTSGQDYVWRKATINQLGGHAMLVVGYDDAKGAFKVVNSWGRSWGRDGYCWITYDLFPQVVKEAYIMKDAVNTNDNTPKPVVDVKPKPGPDVPPDNNSKIDFTVNQVQHNLNGDQFSHIIEYDGTFTVSQYTGKKVQVVISFYHNNGHDGKGLPVGSRSSFHRNPDGTAACSSFGYMAFPGTTPWHIFMPSQYLKLSQGEFGNGMFETKTYLLVAEPVLYVDNVPVKKGALIPFTVKM